ncbi:protein disulfide-isomerase A5 [Elysia marginata]|uniref:Protein disulfide-isomerase A5 n=1 Tax=Elysia marginata TaxID=1093978 RepID=A0AAV4IBM5_9GAST|nr:protein disulfide-isomerase A5 [Elysia marginata]
MKFMENPQEPPPPPPPEKKWEEVESEVVHLVDESFKPFLKKKKHCLVMFYAPWCGHCKKAKPEFMAAAEKLKDDTKVALAAVDCTVQTGICSAHDVTGYPTFKYFNYGKNAQKYMGGRQEEDFIAFMKDPLNPAPSSSTPSPPPAESVEDQWKELAGSDSLSLLHKENFDKAIAENVQMLVMFYAPWCGHCKKMKPDFALAAQKVKEMGLGTLAAVDATQNRELATQYGVKGYPTQKVLRKVALFILVRNKVGKTYDIIKLETKLIVKTNSIEQEVRDYKGGRSESDLVNYMLEALLGDEGSEMAKKVSKGEPVVPFLQSRSIKQLGEKNFHKFLGEKDTAMVLFYQPDCLHCQSAKPHFLKAAKTTNPKSLGGKGKAFGIVDCSKEIDLCMAEQVNKYPSFKLYIGGKFLASYDETPHFNSLREFVANAPEAPTNTQNKKHTREDL